MLSTVVDEVPQGVQGPLKFRSMVSRFTPSSKMTASQTLRRSSFEFWRPAKGSLCSLSPAHSSSQVLKRALGTSNDC
ncbi:hypothetical protein V5799_014236 [Amblyomma americanum]|uniref:Uncharacterized protein n=1 Tax=Amblyomma americanum TaxID=6943 RepID=A0AAQ4E3U9_AMBAM